MMQAVISVGALALLFVVFGLLKPRAGCGAHCSACAGACQRLQSGANEFQESGHEL